MMNHVRRGAGRPLLLIHGLDGSWRSWNPILDDLAREREVIAVDLPGFGETTPLPGEVFIRTLADAVTEFVQANNLAGVDKVLKATGVTGYPYVRAAHMGKPGKEPTPVGLRVNNKKLLDLNAYLAALPAPKGAPIGMAAANRGRDVFRAQCTTCHNVDQSQPVPPVLTPMKRIFPGYRPSLIAKRKPPLSPVQNSPGTFDDKMIVVDASGRGGIKDNALPLLLDPARGPAAPHLFYVRDAARRADTVAFLRSLDTRRQSGRMRAAATQ